jgi:hypothetical protein
LANQNLFLLRGFGVAGAHNLEQVQERIGVEKVVARLPEDVSEMSVEAFEALFHVLSVFSVNQVENDVASAVSIRPFLHFERELELSLAHFKQFCGTVIVFKSDRVGNVVVLN